MKRRLGLHRMVVVPGAQRLFTHSPSGDGSHVVRPAAMEIMGLDLHKRERQAADGLLTPNGRAGRDRAHRAGRSQGWDR